MIGQTTYSLKELVEITGFSTRTIAYYVQEGVLPKIGQQGPGARYDQHYLNRLLVIKRLRELEKQGKSLKFLLSHIRRIFDSLDEDRIAAVASGREPLEVLRAESASPAELQRAWSRDDLLVLDDAEDRGQRHGDQTRPSFLKQSDDLRSETRHARASSSLGPRKLADRLVDQEEDETADQLVRVTDRLQGWLGTAEETMHRFSETRRGLDHALADLQRLTHEGNEILGAVRQLIGERSRRTGKEHEGDDN